MKYTIFFGSWALLAIAVVYFNYACSRVSNGKRK